MTQEGATKAAKAKDKPAADHPTPTTAPKADPPAAEPAKVETKAEPVETPKGRRVSTCVVDGGRGMHVGNAVNGKVCSYHAMHYDARGNRR